MADPAAELTPVGYRVAYSLRLSASSQVVIGLNLGALALLVPAIALFAWPAVARGFIENDSVFSFEISLLDGVLLIGAAVAIVVLHEFVHGLTMKAFGARPRYGIKWELMAAYAVAKDHLFARNAFLAVALMPLLVLTPLMWIATWWLPSGGCWMAAAVAGVLNTIGAVGDLFMTWKVSHYPPSARVLDEEDGLTIFEEASGVGPQASEVVARLDKTTEPPSDPHADA